MSMRSVVCLAFLFVFAHSLCAAPAPASRSWSQDWSLANADTASARWVNGRINPPLREAWRRTIGAQMLPAFAVGSTLYLYGGTDPNEALSAVSSDDGRILWTTPLRVPASIAFQSRVIAFDYNDETLSAFSAASGHLLWHGDPFSYTEYPPLLPLPSGNFLLFWGPVDQTGPPYGAEISPSSGHVLANHRIGTAQWYGNINFVQVGRTPGPNGFFYGQDGHLLETWAGKAPGHLTGSWFMYETEGIPVAAGPGALYLFSYPYILAMNQKLHALWLRELPIRHPNNFGIRNHCPLAVTPKTVIDWDGVTMFGVANGTGRVLWRRPIEQNRGGLGPDTAPWPSERAFMHWRPAIQMAR